MEQFKDELLIKNSKNIKDQLKKSVENYCNAGTYREI